MIRVVAYWCFCAIAITEILVGWNIIDGPDGPFFSYFRFSQVWGEHGTVLLAALLMLPIMLLDVLYISNRFVGPVYRMRRSLRALAAGEYVAPIHFRKGDFQPELADEFNAVANYVEGLKRQLASLAGSPASPTKGEHECEPATHS